MSTPITLMGISSNIGNNVVCCRGKIVMGKKYYNMIFSYILLTIPTIALTYIIANNLDKRIFSLPIVILYYFYFASTFNLFMAGTSDPGIFERKYVYYDGKSTSYYRINGFIQKLNVCYTCNVIRPPRTSHCAECDDCIERFDHHCIWIGNCVGKRNYKYFFLFLLHLNIFGVYGIIISSYVVSLKYTRISLNLEDLDRVYVHIGLSIAVIIYIFGFIFLFLGKLFLLHFWLCIQNLTFYEHIKEKWINYPYKNPFDKKSCCRNFLSLICRKVPKGGLEIDVEKKVKYQELIQY